MEQRFDSIPLGETYFTPEGYLIDNPILTRVGIFEYHNADGTVRRELRLPEEVFAAESLASYKGKPIILTHEAGLVNTDNVQQEHIGTVLSEGVQDGENVRAQICDTRCRIAQFRIARAVTGLHPNTGGNPRNMERTAV